MRFYFESIGDVLGVPLTSDGMGADLVIAVGCVIFAWLSYPVVREVGVEISKRGPHRHGTHGVRPPLCLLDDLWSRLGRARGCFGIELHDIRPHGHGRART